jgi:hypothetical protein
VRAEMLREAITTAMGRAEVGPLDSDLVQASLVGTLVNAPPA